MVGLCFNPKCSEELPSLSQGSVYAWEVSLRISWLCSACSEAFRVATGGNRRPSLMPRSLRIGSEPKGSRVRRVFAIGYGDAREA